MSRTSVSFLCDEQTFTIPSDWTSRWAFLSDLFSDESLADEAVPWVYTDAEELKAWIQLNEAMTHSEQTKLDFHMLLHPGQRMPMSSVWVIVDFMRPTSTEWSTYTQLDEAIPDEDRKDLYAALGRVIRKNGHRFPYARGRTGLLDDFYLWCDPVYSIHTQHYHFSSLPEEVQKSVLDIEDLNVLTGIVHSCYSNKEEMRWRDVASLVKHPYRLDPLDRTVEASPIAYKTREKRQEYLLEILHPTAKNRLAHFMAELPMPEERGPLPLYIDADHLPPSFLSHLFTFCRMVPDRYLACFVDRCALSDYMGGFTVQGDALTSLFGMLPGREDNDFTKASLFIKENHGIEGLHAYKTLLTRYRELIHITTGGRDPIALIDSFIGALTAAE